MCEIKSQYFFSHGSHQNTQGVSLTLSLSHTHQEMEGPTHSDKVLYVIRGARSKLDPTYACASHDKESGRYVTLEVDTTKGRVVNRRVESSREAVEELASNYRGVYMDTRDDPNLMALPKVKNSIAADLDLIRRAKSDEELRDLRNLSAKTRAMLEEGMSEAKFRGTANSLGNRAYFKAHRGKGFTEYRGGMKDEHGRCSDLTRVVAHNAAWEERLARVYRGLDKVEKAAKSGVSIKELDDLFRGCLDETKDAMASSCIHPTGYESNEKFRNFKHLADYDFVTIGVGISDGKDTALIYRSTMEILPLPQKEAPRPPSPTSVVPSSSSVTSSASKLNVFRGTIVPTGKQSAMDVLERAFL